jgi:hypothetical protein
MSRLASRLALVVGLAVVVAGSPDAWGLARGSAQPPKVDPKAQPPKVDPKAKQPAPKAAPSKQPPAKQPDPPAPPTAPPEGEPLPLDGPPNPLDLVRGLREEGMADLALEYLDELGKKPQPPAVQAEIPLERARCLLDAADDEPDEGSRLSLVGEAKEAFQTFLKANPKHPRAAEAYLALARLTSLEAKAQLIKARRIDVPAEDGKERDEAVAKQRAEAAAARPLFEAASGQFQSAAARIDAQLQVPNLDPQVRRALTQAKYDAQLAAGVNQMALADTYLHATAREKTDRANRIDKARELFAALAQDPGTPARVAWVARAWMAECEFEKDNNKVAQDEFDRILRAPYTDAEDGKRMVKFFQLRRKIGEADLNSLPALEREARAWLSQYGSNRRAQAEAVAVKFYLAQILQAQAIGPAPKVPPKTPPVPTGLARARFVEAERLYRQISQTDNEYAFRASKQRMLVVRRLLGEADKPPAAYKTFEEAQMASLIQMSKLMDEERAADADPQKLKDRRLGIIALLERARELGTDKDSPADVAEVLLRLIYYYQATDQPYRAAVLGEHVARQPRAAGGKGAVAGVLGLTGYTAASTHLKVTDASEVEAARRADRERAVRLARYLDEKYPNDTATDRARHRLAGLLYEDGKPVEAYDALLKVRPGYEFIGNARLFEGAVAAQLLSAKDSPLPDDRKRDVFRRATADLDKLPKPLTEAGEDDVRTYLSARVRLALLYLLQPRVDPEEEKAEPGYVKARKVAEDALAQVPTFEALVQGGTKTTNIDGWELTLLAEDARTRAVFLEGQALFLQDRYDEVFAVVGKVLAEMNAHGTLLDATRKLPVKEEEADTKARAEKVAEGADKIRRDLVVLALKVRARQGQADLGAELLDLLKKVGGSIEANVATLQQLTGEMAGQIAALRRAGKADEAKALTEGFARLLDKVSAEPNLAPSVHLFLGQALMVVGEYGRAVESLRKIPAPADPALLAKPTAELEDDQRQTVLLYRRAALELARALRGDKKYDEAAALLKDAMGTAENQKWAFASLDFRKESAYLAEARGAEQADPKAATAHWGEAVKEWTTQVTIARNRLSKEPPKDANGNTDNATVQRYKNAFFDAFFEYNRCILRANMQLRKGNPKLQATFDDIGKKFVEIERSGGPDMYPDVKALYADLLDDVPELKKAYQEAGGKLFLEKPAGPDAGF